jgi:hypothetical protein
MNNADLSNEGKRKRQKKIRKIKKLKTKNMGKRSQENWHNHQRIKLTSKKFPLIGR